MYTRSYYPDQQEIKIPENYDGNAFREIESKEEECASEVEKRTDEEAVLRAPWDVSEKTEAVMGKGGVSAHGLGGLLEKVPFGNLSGFLPFFKGGKFSLGSEEVLICAIALFLLLSRGGDKECAVMLLLLLWIK